MKNKKRKFRWWRLLGIIVGLLLIPIIPVSLIKMWVDNNPLYFIETILSILGILVCMRLQEI